MPKHRSITFYLVSFAVPSEVAMGEHLHLKVSLCQSDAFSALTDWTERSERGKIKPHKYNVQWSRCNLRTDS